MCHGSMSIQIPLVPTWCGVLHFARGQLQYHIILIDYNDIVWKTNLVESALSTNSTVLESHSNDNLNKLSGSLPNIVTYDAKYRQWNARTGVHF